MQTRGLIRTPSLGAAIGHTILLCGGLGGSLAHAAAGDIYNLGTLGGGYSQGLGINDAGQVAGTTRGAAHHAFLYTGLPGSGGAMADLGTLGGTDSYGIGINDAGQVVGRSDTATTGGGYHAFRYTGTPGSGGSMADLGTLGGKYSGGHAINATGQVAGSSTTNDPHFHAFLYTGTPGSGGAMVDLGTLGGPSSYGTAINDAGQVAGLSDTTDYPASHAFLYTGGTMADLGTLGGRSSWGQAINNAGQVTGGSNITGDDFFHAFRYTGIPGSNGAMADLGTLGGTISHGWDINDAGFVVGYATRFARAGDGTWATLWQIDAKNTAVDLDAWLDAINPTLGAYWALREANGINNNGWITGYGAYNDGPGGLADGERAFILDASSLVPEPMTPALLVLGSLFVTRRRRIQS